MQKVYCHMDSTGLYWQAELDGHPEVKTQQWYPSYRDAVWAMCSWGAWNHHFMPDCRILIAFHHTDYTIRDDWRNLDPNGQHYYPVEP